MKMTTIKMKNILQSKLNNPAYRTAYHRDKDELRVEWQDTKQGVTIKIPPVVAKYNERGDSAIDEIVDHIDEALAMMNRTYTLDGMEKHILPVIRSTSFPVEKKDGSKLVMKEHTAETRIFYALDLGKSYRLIDEPLLQESNWTKERLSENARFNLRSLPVTYKKDTVSDNDFYFVALQDGYDASRILNEPFLEEMKAKCEGEMAVAVPHQDVLIIADIRNETGYDVLAQMTMQFFAEGRIPITSLSFIYDEKHLEPIFILAQNKRKK